ncbi:MAG: tyrosine-type recombinase/integrase [Candidatus Schekmanbacteria bacterium]|nr:tyrosine-type recombinase/integrase [Candidatus Schekmanbacteria bacterium]
MKKFQNRNHPKKGQQIKVEPIKDLKDIKAIKKLLADNPRDYALFTIGINTNLRASDLLRLKAGQVRGLKPMDEIEVKEKKTAKIRRITLNETCIKAIERLLASVKYLDTDYLFKSQRGAVLTIPSVHRLVKQWTGTINLKGNYGSHTLRKTFGYHQRVTFGVGLPELMECFNHSTQRQTQTYLCIQPEEIRSVYANQL